MGDWLLDTTIISALMRDDPRVVRRLADIPKGEAVYISVVTNAEVRYGLHRLPAGRRRNALVRAYEELLPQLGGGLDVTREISEICASTKALLENRGIILPENDLWIAATALAHNLTLVTNDAHFSLVPGLRIEDWSRADTTESA